MTDFEKPPPLPDLPRIHHKPIPQPAKLQRLVVNVETGLQATWWAQKTGGNKYWRCDVPARHLPGLVLQLMFSDLQPNGDAVVMPRQRSRTAIWSFPGNATRGIIMRAQQEAGFKVLVEVDDNYLLRPPPIPNNSASWRTKVDRSSEDAHSHEAHARLVSFCDGVIVTTETLAETYRQHHGNVHVCRNSVDVRDWPETEKPSDGIFRIGYAASHSHWFDAREAERALSWAAHQPGVEVVIFGLQREWSFPHRLIPWTTDLEVYRRSLFQLDVGVCPLREGPWLDCKSDIKSAEYSMGGAASIVSRRPPYSEWIDTDFALTADTEKDFLKHVKWCVKNQDGVREMAARAKKYVLGHRRIETEIDKWRVACAS